MIRRFPLVALAPPCLIALVVAGCSGGGDSGLATIPSTAVPAGTEASTPVFGSSNAPSAQTSVQPGGTADLPHDSAGTTTLPTTAPPTTVLVDGAVGLSADGPWHLVDSAPGVTSPGLVYELMPKLWAFLPTEESTNDGSLFVPSPADIPIIEAYLQARLVYYLAMTQSPMDLDGPGWEAFYVDGGAGLRSLLRPRDDEGQVGDLDVGVLLRPFVIGDGRSASTATMFDCTFDGAVLYRADGSLAPGSTPGVVVSGIAATMVMVDDRWQLDHISDGVNGVCG